MPGDKNWETHFKFYYNQISLNDTCVSGIRQTNCKMINHYRNYYESAVIIPSTFYTHNENVELSYISNYETNELTMIYYSNSKGKYLSKTAFTGEATGVNTLPLFGFRETNSTNSTWMFTGKIYFYEIYENNMLVRDYIPVYRKIDNVIGLYDLVNDVFYENAGTGTFLKGNNIVR